MKYLPRLREGCPGWVVESLRPAYLKLAEVARGKGLVGVEVEKWVREQLEKSGQNSAGESLFDGKHSNGLGLKVSP